MVAVAIGGIGELSQTVNIPDGFVASWKGTVQHLIEIAIIHCAAPINAHRVCTHEFFNGIAVGFC